MSEKKVRQHKVLSHPILACLILWVYGYVFYQFVDGIGYVISGNNLAVAAIFGAIGGALLLVIHKLWFKGEFKGCFNFNSFKCLPALIAALVYLAWPILSFVMNYLDGSIVAPTALTIGNSLMAAVAEEAIYRVMMISIMMRAYKEKDNYVVALIVPAILFALIHIPNLFMGASVSSTIIQVIDCIISAIFVWGAIYLRTGDISSCMLIHFLNDVLGMMHASSSTGVMTGTISITSYLYYVVIWAIRIGVGIWLLKGHQEDIKKLWNNIWSTNK